MKRLYAAFNLYFRNSNAMSNSAWSSLLCLSFFSFYLLLSSADILQTWTQIRPDKTWGVIWTQTILLFFLCVFFSKNLILKENQLTTKGMKNYPECKNLMTIFSASKCAASSFFLRMRRQIWLLIGRNS